ncbi:capsular polysaccharide biosynthesis protein [Planomicrobium soli]|uniref:Capsular polysaccharide biosynthesis protein n=1 Tax=Planomicrobium soli TaxID=1176648 RepID=A0A2P8H3G6_9BACL|nr:Wzz/FepE/Etk N-terminal domain-containing protein [Planomicrobium soli]PSL40755.1 capsular polysaccharide biosynthesis protein [Planomicrobium soli]
MEEGISLREVFNILNKYKVLILSITFVAALLAGILSYFVLPPVYEGSTEILVNQNRAQNNQLTGQDVEADIRLIKTYSDIVENPEILKTVSEQLNLGLTAKQMSEQITVTSNENSQVISISVRDKNIERAVSIANTIVEVFSEEVRKLLNVSNVSVISAADIEDNPLPVGPKVFLNTAITSLIGLLFGTSLAFLINYLNTTIKNDQDVENVLNIPVLAMIPSLVEKEKPKEIVKTTFERKEV